jgi:hypothetical protein
MFNLLLSIVELFIGLAFAVKVFGSDVSSGSTFFEYINQILESMGDGMASFASSTEIAGPLVFLVMVLGFMLFGSALFLAVPGILRQGERNARRKEFD